jgi:hypothetical protein
MLTDQPARCMTESSHPRDQRFGPSSGREM